MKEQHHRHLLQHLIPATTAIAPTTNYHKHVDNIKFIISSNSGIIFRFLLIILIGTVSIWANYEASKGFTITIINDAAHSLPGKRFSFFYISDDKATRIVLTTSKFVENILYPDNHYIHPALPKKQVNHVILKLSGQNLTTKFSVESRKNHEYVLHLSLSVMEETNFNHAIESAVQRGMAGIWLWDGRGTTPQGLINGMVEYISSLAGYGPELNSCHQLPESGDVWWKGKGPRAVACVLSYYEKQNIGFIRRLNQAMKVNWNISAVDDVLGSYHN